jgi:hypothetical protein
MNTDDLLRQIEALLIHHEDQKHKASRSDAAKNTRSHVVKRPA